MANHVMGYGTTKSKSIHHELTKGIIIGVLLMVGVCWFWWHLTGDIFHELALILRAKITGGSLIDTCEWEEEDSRGRVYYSDVGVYAYIIPDGRQFKTKNQNFNRPTQRSRSS